SGPCRRGNTVTPFPPCSVDASVPGTLVALRGACRDNSLSALRPNSLSPVARRGFFLSLGINFQFYRNQIYPVVKRGGGRESGKMMLASVVMRAALQAMSMLFGGL